MKRYSMYEKKTWGPKGRGGHKTGGEQRDVLLRKSP